MTKTNVRQKQSVIGTNLDETITRSVRSAGTANRHPLWPSVSAEVAQFRVKITGNEYNVG